jgi:hypothetical protein
LQLQAKDGDTKLISAMAADPAGIDATPRPPPSHHGCMCDFCRKGVAAVGLYQSFFWQNPPIPLTSAMHCSRVAKLQLVQPLE